MYLTSNKSAEKVKEILFGIDETKITKKQSEAINLAIDLIDELQIEGRFE